MTRVKSNFIKNSDMRIFPVCNDIWCWTVSTAKERLLVKRSFSSFPRFGLPKDICINCKGK